jgi:hypothetical protein
MQRVARKDLNTEVHRLIQQRALLITTMTSPTDANSTDRSTVSSKQEQTESNTCLYVEYEVVPEGSEFYIQHQDQDQPNYMLHEKSNQDATVDRYSDDACIVALSHAKFCFKTT